MGYEFKLPDLGEGIHEAQIVRVMVTQGATIVEDAPILEVETDKAAVEIPSPVGGTVTTVHVTEGQTVNVGDVMITFGDAAPSATAAAPASKRPASPAPAAPQPPASQPTAPSAPAVARVSTAGRRTTTPAAPAVRKLARDLGLDLDTITPTGPGGRVTRSDVEQAAEAATSPVAAPTATPAVTPSPVAATAPAAAPYTAPEGVADVDKWGPIRRAPLTQIRKTIARRMAESATIIPHVTTFDFADITELERLRKASGDGESSRPRLTVLAFVIKAVAAVLKRHPHFNASFDAVRQELIFKEYVNIGVAVDTERGLIVPVLRSVENMGLSSVVAGLEALAEKARSAQFAIEDLRGGTFTVTNIGAIGGTFFTPIINYPESAILGVGRSKWEPAVVEGRVEPRYRLPIGLTFDHRIADGAKAARCLKDLIACLENPGWFLMA